MPFFEGPRPDLIPDHVFADWSWMQEKSARAYVANQQSFHPSPCMSKFGCLQPAYVTGHELNQLSSRLLNMCFAWIQHQI